MKTKDLCEAWFHGEPCFREIMTRAIEEIHDLDWLLSREFGTGEAIAPRWAEGISAPHPILQSKIVEVIFEASR